MAIPLLGAILPFLGQAAMSLLKGNKDKGGGGIGNILGGAMSLLGGGKEQQEQKDTLINANQPSAQTPTQLFQYDKSPSYGNAIAEMLKKLRGF